MRIAIIGSNPSKHNIDPNIPFVGTRSFTRLTRWISYLAEHTDLKSSNFHLLNVSTRISDKEVKYTEDELANLYYNSQDYDMIISLGNNVKKACLKKRVFQYNLPHPSFKNRKLNNPLEEKKLLDELVNVINLNKQFNLVDPDWSFYH